MPNSEFIEHYFMNKNFVTDIWYHSGTTRFHSVVTDLYNESFLTLEEIREALNQLTYKATGYASADNYKQRIKEIMTNEKHRK